MFSLSPAIVSALEWHLEEQMFHEIPCDDRFASCNNNETDTSPNSGSCPPQLPDFEDEDINNSSTTIKTPANSVKKSGHNDYERDQRKKLNKLYSYLRDLLPEKDQRKKFSIPCTVARVLKYIPELQRHVQRLIRKKEELKLMATKDEFASAYSSRAINPVISAIFLSRREIMIQICILSSSAAITFSKVVKILERQGLQLDECHNSHHPCRENFLCYPSSGKGSHKDGPRNLLRETGEFSQRANSLWQDSGVIKRFQMPGSQRILQH